MLGGRGTMAHQHCLQHPGCCRLPAHGTHTISFPSVPRDTKCLHLFLERLAQWAENQHFLEMDAHVRVHLEKISHLGVHYDYPFSVVQWGPWCRRECHTTWLCIASSRRYFPAWLYAFAVVHAIPLEVGRVCTMTCTFRAKSVTPCVAQMCHSGMVPVVPKKKNTCTCFFLYF